MRAAREDARRAVLEAVDPKGAEAQDSENQVVPALSGDGSSYTTNRDAIVLTWRYATDGGQRELIVPVTCPVKLKNSAKTQMKLNATILGGFLIKPKVK